MLKIIFDKRDTSAEARRYFRLVAEAENRGRSYHGPKPRIRGGAGVELGQCQNCSDEMWVKATNEGWGYCDDCKPEKKRRGIKIGFD
jgi:hypothetical protein